MQSNISPPHCGSPGVLSLMCGHSLDKEKENTTIFSTVKQDLWFPWSGKALFLSRDTFLTLGTPQCSSDWLDLV